VGRLLGIGYYAVRRYRRGAWVVGAAVVSHWLLDLPMHRPDLQLTPWSSRRVGLGAWNSIPLTILLETLVLGVGLAMCARTTRPRDAAGRWALWAMVAMLVLIFVSGFIGAPPPSERALALFTLGLWLFVPWGYWIDRHRTVVTTPTEGSSLLRPPTPEDFMKQ